MAGKKYVIDAYYDFDITADGPRPGNAGSSGVHLQFDHDDVMAMGEYFYNEDPYEMDFYHNFGIKDKLDDILRESIVAELEEEWENEHENSEDGEDEERPDFEDWACDRMCDMYFTWDQNFKDDCIDYYLLHKDETNL